MDTLRIVVPCVNHDTVLPECRASLERMKQKRITDRMHVEIVQVTGTTISDQRCRGANLECSDFENQNAFDSEWDNLLCVDSDIEFETTDVERLLSLNLDLVGGAYKGRGREAYCAGDFLEDGTKIIRPNRWLGLENKGLVKVDWIGMGFTLIKRDVLRKMKYPWWREHFTRYPEDGVTYPNRKGDIRISYLGDDIGFCINAAESGYEIWCDCSTIVKHHCGEDNKK
jgi:hypothetical protein